MPRSGLLQAMLGTRSLVSLSLGLGLLADASPAGQEEAPRLRTPLSNGAAVFVEAMSKAKTVSVQLIAAARGCEETPATSGLRHLLEHLLVKGRGKDLDYRLESQGMFLSAETFRDFTKIEVACAPDKLGVALSALSELLAPPEIGAEEIAREARIMAEEAALHDAPRRLSAELWSRAFGPIGADPSGSLEVVAAATPEALRALHARHFRASNLVLAIAGPVSVDAATREARKVLEGLPKSETGAWAPREPSDGGSLAVQNALGEARAAVAPGISEPRTAWLLAAALAIAGELPAAFVTYTPSIRPGLVIVGRAASDGRLSRLLQSFRASDETRLFEAGKSLARRWVRAQTDRPSDSGLLHGSLMAQAFGARPDSILQNVDAMTRDQFRSALRELSGAEPPGPADSGSRGGGGSR